MLHLIQQCYPRSLYYYDGDIVTVTVTVTVTVNGATCKSCHTGQNDLVFQHPQR